MKGSGKIILTVAFLTSFFLFYVHEQVALVRLSYLIDRESDEMAHHRELYRRLKFEVEQLKAPRLLEAKMKELSLDLTLPKEFRVISVPASAPVDSTTSGSLSRQPISEGVLQFLGRWVNIAQAKTKLDS